MRNMDFFGLINSKIYSYVEVITDSCLKNCHDYKTEDKIDERFTIDTSVFRFNTKSATKNDLLREDICMENCFNKELESYIMLLNVRIILMKNLVFVRQNEI